MSKGLESTWKDFLRQQNKEKSTSNLAKWICNNGQEARGEVFEI